MNIYLVRHTTPDVELVYCYGQTDLDIKPTFMDEVKRVISVIPDLENPPVFSSPLKRCAKLARALDLGTVTFDDRLKELDFGEWEMQKWDDINQEKLDYWVEDFVCRKAPGGESYQQMCDRVMEFINEVVLETDNENVIIVSHGGTIRAVMATILEMPLINLFKLNLDFGGVVRLTEKDGNLRVDWVNR